MGSLENILKEKVECCLPETDGETGEQWAVTVNGYVTLLSGWWKYSKIDCGDS